MEERTLIAAMQVLATISKAKPKVGDKGETVCPKCGGKFLWSWHGPRAIRGACVTAGCLSFLS